MAKETDAVKAKETILKFFKQKNLENDRISIISSLIESMIIPQSDENKEVEKLKRELNLYKSEVGPATKKFIKEEMKKLYPDSNKEN